MNEERNTEGGTELKKLIAIATMSFMVTACSTGTAKVEYGVVTATAEAVTEGEATTAARELWGAVCAEVGSREPSGDPAPQFDFGLAITALQFVDTFLGLMRRYSVTITKPCP